MSGSYVLADYTMFGYRTLDKAFYAGVDGGGVRSAALVTPVVNSTLVTSTGTAETGTQFYRLRGWYAAGSTFEVWVSSNPYSSPPSGHTLDDISFVPFDVGA
jgi:hypothetical protein